MISIIIPTRNEEAILEKTLRRVRQDVRTTEYELIVSDGASTDTTVAIAERWADRVVRHTASHRQTIGEGKNRGADGARGEWLVFLDADVEINSPDDFFARACAVCETHHAVGLTVRLAVYPSAATRADRFWFAVVNATHAFLNNVVRQGSASGEFQMVRASVFRSVGGFREDLVATEDNELFWRLARIGTTRMERSLTVFHSGRRAHRIGWTRLLWAWMTSAFAVACFKKSIHKEWEPIR